MLEETRDPGGNMLQGENSNLRTDSNLGIEPVIVQLWDDKGAQRVVLLPLGCTLPFKVALNKSVWEISKYAKCNQFSLSDLGLCQQLLGAEMSKAKVKEAQEAAYGEPVWRPTYRWTGGIFRAPEGTGPKCMTVSHTHLNVLKVDAV